MALKRTLMMAVAPFAVAVFASPASAQGIPVFDSTSYLQALATVQHTATMIQQGEQQITQAQQTFNSLSKLTNVNSIAPNLLQSQIRNILPNTTIDAATLNGGDLTKIGSLAGLASNLQTRYALTPTGSSADAAYAQSLKDATGGSAAMAALGENTLSVTQTRMQGIDQLRQQLDNAKDPKDVMDLQARISAEQAQLQNDMIKIQAIQMAQAGEAHMTISAAQVAASRETADFYDANTIRK